MKLFNLKTDYLIATLGGLLFFLCLGLFIFTKNSLFIYAPIAIAFLAWLSLNLKSFYWFFILSIPFSFTIYLSGGSLSTTIPDEPIMWLFLGLTTVMVIYNYKIFPTWYFKDPIIFIFFLQIIWLFVALIFSENFFLSFKYTLARLWFLNAFLIIPIFFFKDKKDFKNAFLLFVIPVSIHAFFAFLWHAKLGFGYQESNAVVFPFYQNHVDYSTILSMVFPLLLVAFSLSKGNLFHRILLRATILFYIPAIIAASARAAILAVVFAFMISFLIRIRKVQFVMPAIFLIMFLVIGYMSNNNNYFQFRPTPHTATQETFQEAVVGIFTGKDMSSMERFYRWIAGIRMSQEHPLVGVGPNNFYDNYKPYTVPTFATWVSRNEEQSTTHNYFLLMLVEQGWPAMILYALLLLVVFKRAQTIYHRSSDPFYKKVTMGLIMLFAASFVNNFFSELLETHKVGALFYMSICLLIIIDHITAREEKYKSIPK